MQIQTVEHLLAAVRGLGIDNLLIELNGPELPAMDGSSAPFVSLLYTAGRDAQVAVRRPALRVLEPIRVGDEHRLDPAPAGGRVPHQATPSSTSIRRSVCRSRPSSPTERVFVEELAPARTTAS